MTDREDRAILVRDTWVETVRELIPDPKPGWLAPYRELDDFQKEVDARIGETVARAERLRIVILLLNTGHPDAALQISAGLMPAVCQARRWLSGHDWEPDGTGLAGTVWRNGVYAVGLQDEGAGDWSLLQTILRAADATGRRAGDVFAEMRNIEQAGRPM